MPPLSPMPLTNPNRGVERLVDVADEVFEPVHVVGFERGALVGGERSGKEGDLGGDVGGRVLGRALIGVGGTAGLAGCSYPATPGNGRWCRRCCGSGAEGGNDEVPVAVTIGIGESDVGGSFGHIGGWGVTVMQEPMLDAVGPRSRAHEDVHMLLVLRETGRQVLRPLVEPGDNVGFFCGIHARGNCLQKGEDLVLDGLGE